MPTRLSRLRWTAAVDRIMKRDWSINAADAGLGEDDLARHWRDGHTPEAFVAWFAQKYDLIRFDEVPRMQGGA